MPHLTKLFWLLLLPTLFFAACKEDDDCTEYVYPWCPNYDPCASVYPADAEIVMIDSTTWTDSLFSIEVDTTLTYSHFYFRPKNVADYAAYSWKIGSDPRTFEGAIQDIGFLGFEGEIEATLTTQINDQNSCLTTDEEYAISSKSIYFKDLTFTNGPIWGSYTGANDDSQNNTYTVNFQGWVTDLFDSNRLFQLKLPEDCDLEEVGIPLGGGYSWAVSDFVNRSSSRRCRNLTVVCKLEHGNYNRIRIDYWYNDDDGKRVRRTFRGERQ
ncbi:hypothetical protein [Lewinella cohaerens]|uniref:hypothetical protein n=1 Tax=Lewinella cohaerens TaxID=70995 RepID=UPI00036A4707|nr:hypothetical protein [Lewinella cohaerens]